jgi:hypothetical protein
MYLKPNSFSGVQRAHQKRNLVQGTSQESKVHLQGRISAPKHFLKPSTSFARKLHLQNSHHRKSGTKIAIAASVPAKFLCKNYTGIQCISIAACSGRRMADARGPQFTQPNPNEVPHG